MKITVMKIWECQSKRSYMLSSEWTYEKSLKKPYICISLYMYIYVYISIYIYITWECLYILIKCSFVATTCMWWHSWPILWYKRAVQSGRWLPKDKLLISWRFHWHWILLSQNLSGSTCTKGNKISLMTCIHFWRFLFWGNLVLAHMVS